jgi:cell wall-associated NlpC family hydrolase
MMRRTVPVTVALLMLALFLAPTPAQADRKTPTRHDVQQARSRVADKAAQVAAVRGRLATAQQGLQQAQITAEQAAETYNQARWELQQATQAAADALTRAGLASQQLQQQRDELASVVTQSYEGGGQLATLQAVFGSQGPQQLMSQYASYAGVSSALDADYQRFTALSVLADLYQRQAEQARQRQSQLADQAQQALLSAQQAESQAAAVSDQVAAQRDRLTRQLARLQGISAGLAAQRQQALERRAAEKAAKQAAREERRTQRKADQQGSNGSAGSSSGAPTGSESSPQPPPPPSSRAAQAVEFAKAQRGDPYVYGAAGPDAWDCSGLVLGAWGAAGVSLPHSASLQYSLSSPIAAADLRPGDLVFWSSDPSDWRTIYHVAIYIGHGKIIQAPRPGEDVQIDPLYYWIRPTFYARV